MLVVAVRAKKRGLLNVGARARRERTRMTPHTQARKQFFPKSLLALFFWPSLFVRCDSSQPPALPALLSCSEPSRGGEHAGRQR